MGGAGQAGAVLVCESTIEEVAVYARGADVTRKVLLPERLPEGPCSVVVTNITAFCELGSFRAELLDLAQSAPREIVAVRTRFVAPSVPAPKDELLRRAQETLLERIRLKLKHAEAQKQRELLSVLTPDPGLLRKAAWSRNPAARTADALAAGALIGGELAKLDRRLIELSRALDENRRRQEALDAEAVAHGNETQAVHVEARIELGPGGPVSGLLLTYAVAQARWAPMYTARFSEGARHVSAAMFAMVAQASGEDWQGVRISLSTADRARDTALPSLPSLRLGRAGPSPERGYRPPPRGLDAMFAGMDRFVRDQALQREKHPLDQGVLDEGGGKASLGRRSGMVELDGLDAVSTPPQVTLHSMDMTDARRMEMPSARGAAMEEMARESPDTSFMLEAEGGRGEPEPAEQTLLAPAMPERRQKAAVDAPALAKEEAAKALDRAAEPVRPEDGWLDFDNLVLADFSQGSQRGKLVSQAQGREDDDWALRNARQEKERLRMELFAASLPEGMHDPRGSGLFDVRFDAAGRSDVPSNAHFCRVPVQEAEAEARVRFVGVPREEPAVYREAEIQNPFGKPVPSGPVELFFDQAYAGRSFMEHADRGGRIVLGLGVEERIRVKRRARVEESSVGLLGGSLAVDHFVTIELNSALGYDVDVSIFDQIPVSDDKDVEVKRLSMKPEGEAYTQAERGAPIRRGFRWQVELPSGGNAAIAFQYRVTLPSKSEIVGGNRRES